MRRRLRVDLNRAGRDELERLPGGIGPATISRLKPRLRIGSRRDGP